ncbi:hypothetical protein CFC21_080274 [Triticum aestivum]|uniref:Uncharacterized protein n=2 Tax=Triticum aestivum TaxID=4565 RepID=A0A9R1L2R2_WHEAT|nr:hypothetical protein CFC21_080274 [Triticum aestivum]
MCRVRVGGDPVDNRPRLGGGDRAGEELPAALVVALAALVALSVLVVANKEEVEAAHGVAEDEADAVVDGADGAREQEHGLVVGPAPERGVAEAARVLAPPAGALQERAAGLVGGELAGRLLEVGERVQLGVERGRGRREAVELPEERRLGLRRGGEEGVGRGRGAAGEEVGVDVVEALERRGGAAAAEARGDGGDAVERIELLGEREGEEARVVARDERADGVGAEAERAEQAGGLGGGERAVEAGGARHGVGQLEGQDADPAAGAVLVPLPAGLLVGEGALLVRQRKEGANPSNSTACGFELEALPPLGWLRSISKINGGAEKSTRRDSTGSTVTRQQELAALPPLTRERETKKGGKMGEEETKKKENLSRSPVGAGGVVLAYFLPPFKERNGGEDGWRRQGIRE